MSRISYSIAVLAVFAVVAVVSAAPAAAQDNAPFADTPTDAWYTVPVSALTADGVFAGTECDEGFCPGEAIDRATMAVWTVRVLDGEDPVPVGSTRFGDVGGSHPQAAFIERFAQLGVTEGCGDGSNFCPDKPVTRAQMAVFLWRAFGLADGPDPGFGDVAPDAWYATEVAGLAASGITKGCGDGTNFCPEKPTTRAEMATFLHRAEHRDANDQQVMDFLKTNIFDRYGPEHPWLQEVWNYALDSGFQFKIDYLNMGPRSHIRATDHIRWCTESDPENRGTTSTGLPLHSGIHHYQSACQFTVPDMTFLSASHTEKFVREFAHVYVESIRLLEDPVPIALTQVYFHRYMYRWGNHGGHCYPIGLMVDIMVQFVLPTATMQWWPNCVAVPDQPDVESVTAVKQALAGQIPDAWKTEFSSTDGTVDHSRVWACAAYYDCERFTGEYIAAPNLIYQLSAAFGGYCSRKHVDHLITVYLELSISQPWRDGGCGDPSPTATPGFLTASNRASRWYKSVVDRHSTQHPWLAAAWNQTNRPDYQYVPILRPYQTFHCGGGGGACIHPGSSIVSIIGAHTGVTDRLRPPTSEPVFYNADTLHVRADAVIHELAHELTIAIDGVPRAGTIAIGMLYFNHLYFTLDSQALDEWDAWCHPDELFAQAAEELVFPQDPPTAFNDCMHLDSHSEEAVAVARDTLNGVMPNWLYTQFGTDNGGIDYVQLWESVRARGGWAIGRALQYAFGGYCFDIVSVLSAVLYDDIKLPDNARQPWVDGGCPG